MEGPLPLTVVWLTGLYFSGLKKPFVWLKSTEFKFLKMINDAGREIPEKIEGLGSVRPFRKLTLGRSDQKRNRANIKKPLITERVPRISKNLEGAISRSGLKNRDRISFHHHLRLGDSVVEQVLFLLEQMGYRELILCVSSVMGPATAAVLRAVRGGVIRRIETTGLKSPLSEALQAGEIPEPVIFRSHGGRARAIENGETPINLAFIAASEIDREGNMTGTQGINRFGSMGYAIVDAENAFYVIGLTDSITSRPLLHISISACFVDEVVELISIGSKSQIAGGSIRISRRPVEKLIARRAVQVLAAAEVIKPDFSYQSGSGGISLLVTALLKEYMMKNEIVGSFASGGVTGNLVDLMRDGFFDLLWDVQSFDDKAAVSLGENPSHREMSASLYANPENPGCIAHKLDVMILSATEIDRDFHVNSITGTNGRILGALGGAPDTAAGASLTIVVLPSFRGRIPTVNHRVQTVCTPGNTVDVLVSERGIAVNPQREDLLRCLNDSGLEIFPIKELVRKVHNLTGEPDQPIAGNRIRGVVEYRDGSILDCIRS
ncbi:MAG: citrate lyase subunit alpha [Spirochaetes bacterium]|nr:MAG: citrate lyase subunit alpha [Spirochaetota bacterium]